MKYLFALIFLALVSCRISRPPSELTVTIDFVLRVPGDSSEVWAKRRRMYNNPGYVWYIAKMASVPDSIRVGKKIVLKQANDSCHKCVIFKQIK